MEEKQKNGNGEAFTYSYSAKQQEEIRRIRNKYMPQKEDKLEQLRRLDRSVEKPGMRASIFVGTIGTLIMGLGMSLCLVWAGKLMVPGIVIGAAGIALAAAAYPVNQAVTKKQREKMAPQILKLTEELMQE